MKKIIILALFLGLAGLGGSAAIAKGGAGHGAVGMEAGGRSATNSNGVRSIDRDKGLERADDRRYRSGKAKRHARKYGRRVL